MKIRIGTKLLINPEGLEDQITTYYVGEKKGRHIVLACPEKELLFAEKIMDPAEARVQFFEDDVRYEFKGKVIEMIEEPVDLLILEYPSEIYPVDKRAMGRINCLVSAKLKNQQDNSSPPAVGVIENINKAGCLCSLAGTENSRISFSIGDRVHLICQFPGLVGEQSAEGKVVRIKEEGKDIVLGLHFDNETSWIPPYSRK